MYCGSLLEGSENVACWHSGGSDRGAYLNPLASNLAIRRGATDVMIYAGVTGPLLLVALVASSISAARAASVDPMQALRSE